MANKAYSAAFKREAVALGRVMGAEAASAHLGITGRETLRRWMEQAGALPELQGTQAQWQSLADLAHAKTMASLASGKLSAVQTATIAGIAERNLREAKATDLDKVAGDAFLRARGRYWISAVIALRVANRMGEPLDDLITAMETYIGDPSTEVLALIALQTYHRDHGCELHDGSPGQWRNDCPAPLDNIWTYLESLGDLDDWDEARRAADQEAMVRQARPTG